MRTNRKLCLEDADQIETLADYVARVIKENNLTHREVELMSGGKITDGYVRGIMTGKAKNPSVAKLKALARGLGVSEEEIFKVARGEAKGETGAQEAQTNYWVIVDLMAASLKNRSLVELLSEVAKLPKESHNDAIKALRYLNERKRRASQSKNC